MTPIDLVWYAASFLSMLGVLGAWVFFIVCVFTEIIPTLERKLEERRHRKASKKGKIFYYTMSTGEYNLRRQHSWDSFAFRKDEIDTVIDIILEAKLSK